MNLVHAPMVQVHIIGGGSFISQLLCFLTLSRVFEITMKNITFVI
jgi:hypothetical protein